MQTSLVTTTATDNVKEDNTQVNTTSNVDHKAEMTSSPRVALDADQNDETEKYAPITAPPSDKSNNAIDHYTTKVSCSSQIASSVKTTEEDLYAPIIQLSSDEPNGIDEDGLFKQQLNLNRDSLVNSIHDTQLLLAADNVESHAEGM